MLQRNLQSTEITVSEFLVRYFEIAKIGPLDRVNILSHILAKLVHELPVNSPEADTITIPIKRGPGRPPGAKNKPRIKFSNQNHGGV